MAKFSVTLADNRVIPVYAPDEAGAMKQAAHHETQRVVIATKRNQPITVQTSHPVSVVKVKD